MSRYIAKWRRNERGNNQQNPQQQPTGDPKTGKKSIIVTFGMKGSATGAMASCSHRVVKVETPARVVADSYQANERFLLVRMLTVMR
ncbi:MAG: hypothetical protein JNN00_17885 [Chitinophagaceae bacterium]|nr:hypothetical protein [Chitinophagaceae bacterium]